MATKVLDVKTQTGTFPRSLADPAGLGLFLSLNYGLNTIETEGANLPPDVALSSKCIVAKEEVQRVIRENKETFVLLKAGVNSSVLQAADEFCFWNARDVIDVVFSKKDRSRSISDDKIVEVRRVNTVEKLNELRADFELETDARFKNNSDGTFSVINETGSIEQIFTTDVSPYFEILDNKTLQHSVVDSSFKYLVTENTGGVTSVDVLSTLIDKIGSPMFNMIPSSVVGVTVSAAKVYPTKETKQVISLPLIGALDDTVHRPSLYKFGHIISGKGNFAKSRNQLRQEVELFSQKYYNLKVFQQNQRLFSGQQANLKNKVQYDSLTENQREGLALAEASDNFVTALQESIVVKSGSSDKNTLELIQSMKKDGVKLKNMDYLLKQGQLVLKLVKPTTTDLGLNNLIFVDRVEAIGFDSRISEKYRARTRKDSQWLSDLEKFSSRARAIELKRSGVDV